MGNDYSRKKADLDPNSSARAGLEFDHAGWVLGAGGDDYETPLTDDELVEFSSGNDVVWVEREAG